MWLPLWFHVTYFFLSFSFCATCAHIWSCNFSELWPCFGPLIGAQETAELIFWGKQRGEAWWAEEGSLQEVTSLWLLYTRLSRPSSPPSLHSECVLGIVTFSLSYPLCVCLCERKCLNYFFTDIYCQHLTCVVCALNEARYEAHYQWPAHKGNAFSYDSQAKWLVSTLCTWTESSAG